MSFTQTLLHWLGFDSGDDRDGWRPLDPEEAHVGQRVRRAGDTLEGTLSGWLMLDGVTLARVVFTGARNSWVDLVPIGTLEMA
jgi:hypothetical protein